MLDTGLPSRWVVGAILPSELIWFLHHCERTGVRHIIESGRQDGYSTEVLGTWAKANGATVVSIDDGYFPDRDAASKVRVAHLPVECRNGDSMDVFGMAVRDAGLKPIGLILDGPKFWNALMLVAAARRVADIRVAALHNLEAPYFVERDWCIAHGFEFHESIAPEGDEWGTVIEIEDTAKQSQHEVMGRPSSLGVTTFPVPLNFSPYYGAAQPGIISLMWRINMYRHAGRLMRRSNRIVTKVRDIRKRISSNS